MNGTDLWELARRLKAEGVVRDASELNKAIVKARDESSSSVDDSEIGKIVSSVFKAPPASKRAKRDFSEAGIAEHFAAGHLPKSLRYSTVTQKWHAWNGVFWQETKDSIPVHLQLEIRRLAADALKANQIDAKGVLRICSASGLRGIAGLLSAWPSAQMANECDPPHFLVLPNGVFDLNDGELLAPESKRPVTRACPVSPSTGSPLWPPILAHLRACCGDQFAAVHRYLGSSLRGLGADRRVLWLWGPGDDGKSTLVKLLQASLGDYATVLPSEVVSGDARGSHGHELASGLIGARLAVVTEVERVDWNKLKGWSGGDTFATKRAHGKRQSVTRPPCFVIVGNQPPQPPDRASAERLIVVEMRPPDEQNELLIATLKTPGCDCDLLAGSCLSWLLEGCAEFIEHGLGPCAMFGYKPSGLDLWWSEMVASGQYVPGAGWARLMDAKAYLPDGLKCTSDRDLSAFLQSKVERKRHMTEGVRYGFSLTMKGHEGSKHYPLTRIEESLEAS